MEKMTSVQSCKTNNNSNSSELHLLANEQQQPDSYSSISRNSIYKLKIDLLFDDTRSVRSNRFDDPHGSHRTRSIIMYGRSELAKAGGDSASCIANYLEETNGNENANSLADKTKKDVQRISNSVQAQIEKLFNDVAKDAINTFTVTCLGSLPLNEKINSLQGLQKPLRKLFCRERNEKEFNSGILEICSTGLHIKTIPLIGQNDCINKIGENECKVTPFRHIAVWSAVKFIISSEEGGAAFLPLITSPENIDKKSLFEPLNAYEKKNLPENPHVPLFAVVIRSVETPKMLECHAYICKTTEEAIIIAATLYQTLMSHVNFNTHRNTKRRPPRNQNGISCVSIASSSALTSPNYSLRPPMVTNSRKNSPRGSLKISSISYVSRSGRKKRFSNMALNSNGNIIKETTEASADERKRKSYKAKRAPPVPTTIPLDSHCCNHKNLINKDIVNIEMGKYSQYDKKKSENDYIYKSLKNLSHDITSPLPMLPTLGSSISAGISTTDSNGDILTRVAIPRSGSFLNTAGLTRYKSRATHRYSNKYGSSLNGYGNINGGGGGELFNEFRLHENLHSLDEILYAIINSDGMSFNDLKPIYKEFLLKLAVTLTKDELFQRSKNIMRRQKKKKRKTSRLNISQRKTTNRFFGTANFINVFRWEQFRSCRGKLFKLKRNKQQPKKEPTPTIIDHGKKRHSRHTRLATSGSDISVIRHDSTFHRINRNSSSGYVSCSECSYDSEACTCTSADRCYCSLRGRKSNNNIKRKHDRKHIRKIEKSKITFNNSKNNSSKMQNLINNRNSYISCKSDEKCYCSMTENESHSVNTNDKEEQEIRHSDHHSETTWCDTDSCKSATKCYCKNIVRPHSEETTEDNCPKNQDTHNANNKYNKSSDQLALDYELFKINGNSQSVQPNEALSVKKSVEAAALFADVKLSQTTDIKNVNSSHITNLIDCDTRKSYSISARRKSSAQHKSDIVNSIGRYNEHNLNIQQTLKHNLQKSSSSDNVLHKLSNMNENADYKTSIHDARLKTDELNLNEKFQNNYQSMRAISASLEDALGYLP